jgi:hypothetical protein
MTRRYPPRSAALYDPETEMPRPVIGLDIDGTIGKYHEHFLKFAEGWFGKTHGEWTNEPYNGSVLLYRWMGVSKTRYRQCKLAFRKGGLKRCMPVYEGAADFSRKVRKRGATLIICTTRPFLMLDNIDPDTTEWLRRNRIQHDGIFHGERKYFDLVRRYGLDRVVMVMDDLPEMIMQAVDSGISPVMIERPHNRDWRPDNPTLLNRNWIHPVPNLEAALRVALTRIGEYERQQEAAVA